MCMKVLQKKFFTLLLRQTSFSGVEKNKKYMIQIKWQHEAWTKQNNLFQISLKEYVQTNKAEQIAKRMYYWKAMVVN